MDWRMECHAFSLISVIKKLLIHSHIWFFPRFLIYHIPVVLINVLTCLDKMESYFTHSNLKWFHSFYPVPLMVPLPCLCPPLFYTSNINYSFVLSGLFTLILSGFHLCSVSVIRNTPSPLSSPGPKPSLLTSYVLNSRPLYTPISCFFLQQMVLP